MLERFGEDAFVQMEQDDVVAGELAIEPALHVAMGSEALNNVPPEAFLSGELHRFEPVNVFGEKEHKSANGLSLVHAEWVPGESRSFEYDGFVWGA